jgi:hypothetical protein
MMTNRKTTDARPVFRVPVRPMEVPADLLALPPDTEVIYIEAEKAGWSGNGATSAGKLADSIKQTIQRHGDGWFFAQEAAQLLADAHQVDAVDVFRRMGDGFRNGDLATFSIESKLKRQATEEWGGWSYFVTPDSVDVWLAEQGAPYLFPAQARASSTQRPPVPEAVAPAPRPMLQQAHQEAEILRVLSELGCNPKALPRNVPGKRGVKADARGRLSFSTGVFDKAWDRLRAAGDIADA